MESEPASPILRLKEEEVCHYGICNQPAVRFMEVCCDKLGYCEKHAHLINHIFCRRA